MVVQLQNTNMLSTIENEKCMVKLLRDTPKEKLFKMKHTLDEMYYTLGETVTENWKYDMLKEYLDINEIGAPIISRDAVLLPWHLGSVDKITSKDAKVLDRWLVKMDTVDYLISDKLDGVSGLLHSDGGIIRLYTRGDGTKGRDISHILKYIRNIPSHLPNGYVRGELIIPKDKFVRNTTLENGKCYKCARNMVAGLLNSKEVCDQLKLIDFIAYELVAENPPTPSEQLDRIKIEWKMDTVNTSSLKSGNVTFPVLSSLLIDRESTGSFEIDGLVVTADINYTRNTSDNPDYVKAFKLLHTVNIHDTIVEKVEWKLSRWGKFIPVVIFEPVETEDATMSRVSANNAKYINDNDIGPGSLIKVTRSNGVIPWIVQVVKSTIAQMPPGQWVWDENKTHAKSEHVETKDIGFLCNFFKALDIKHMGKSTVSKLYNGGLKTLIHLLKAKPLDFQNATSNEKIKIRSTGASKIYKSIHNGLINIDVWKVIGASGLLGEGRGIRKTRKIWDEWPNVFRDIESMDKKDQISKLSSIKGFSEATSIDIIERLPFVKKWISSIDPWVQWSNDASNAKKGDLMGRVLCMSGFRDATFVHNVIGRGGVFVDKVTKNTTDLVVKCLPIVKDTGKTRNAKKLGINIIDVNAFK